MTIANAASVLLVLLGLSCAYVANSRFIYNRAWEQIAPLERLRAAARQIESGGGERKKAIYKSKYCDKYLDLSCPDLNGENQIDTMTLYSTRIGFVHHEFVVVPIPITSILDLKNYSKQNASEKVFDNINGTVIKNVYFIHFSYSDPSLIFKTIDNKGNIIWKYRIKMDNLSRYFSVDYHDYEVSIEFDPENGKNNGLVDPINRTITSIVKYGRMVDDEYIDIGLLQSAREISGKYFGIERISEAMQIFASGPALEFSIGGLPNNVRLFSMLAPFFFLYSAIMFRHCIIVVHSANNATKDEPWLLANSKNTIEKYASTIWKIILNVSGLCVLSCYIAHNVVPYVTYRVVWDTIFSRGYYENTPNYLWAALAGAFDDIPEPKGWMLFTLVLFSIVCGSYCISLALWKLTIMTCSSSSIYKKYDRIIINCIEFIRKYLSYDSSVFDFFSIRKILIFFTKIVYYVFHIGIIVSLMFLLFGSLYY